MSSYNSSKLDQISIYRLAKESTPGRRGNKPTRKFISLDRPIKCGLYLFNCYAPINVRPAGGEAGQGGGI